MMRNIQFLLVHLTVFVSYSTVFSQNQTVPDQNRTITLRNKVELTFPIILSVVAGIQCLQNDSQCLYENGIGPGAHDLAALPLAIEDIKKNPDWRYFHDMQVAIFDSSGREMTSIEAVTNATTSVNSLAIIGPQDTCKYEPGIAAMDTRFMLSYRCGGRPKVDKSMEGTGVNSAQVVSDFSTFAQLRSSFDDISHAVVDYVKWYKWDRIVLLHVTDHSVQSFSTLDTVTKSLQSQSINVIKTYTIDNRITANYVPLESFARLKYVQILVETQLKTRAYVVLSTTPASTETFFLCDTMGRMGLLQTGEYVVMVATATTKYNYLYNGSEETADVWLNYPIWPDKSYVSHLLRRPSPVQVYQYYRSAAFFIETRPISVSPIWQQFQSRVRQVWKNPPCPPLCNIPIREYPPPYPSGYVPLETGLLYDAVVSWVNATVEMIISNISDPHNGDVMVQQYGERTVHSVSGIDIYVDSFGIPLGNVTILTACKADKTSKLGLYPVGQFWLNITDNDVGWYLQYFNSGMNWPNQRAPPASPRCGFNGDACHNWKDYTTPIIICGVLVVLVISVGAAVILYSQWKYERELQGLFWKILSEDLKLQDLHEHMTSMRSMGSATLGAFQSTATLQMRQSLLSLGGYEKNLVKEIKRNKATDGAAAESRKKLPPLKKAGYHALNANQKRRKAHETEEHQKKLWADLENFTVAEYKGQLVALKRIHKPNLEFTRAVRKELKYLMDLKEEHLHGVLGIVHEPIGVYLVSEFRQRGCLKDVLENEDIEIDSLFLASMVGDLIKGLTFLHQSPLKCHGNLKSTNCLVDARWVLRVSAFDMVVLRQDEERQLTEEELYRRLLWTAPELLRDAIARIKGTHKGDVYSFGIVLHEMFGRKGPFGDELLNPVEVVNQVMNPKSDESLYRPDMTVLEEVPTYVELTMKMCWEENPDDRPNMEGIKKKLSPMLKGMQTSVVENIITMMERYSNNLENMVADRTDQLQQERKKTERLLLMMLPPSIAESLRAGNSVEPERFDCVSFYFSDIAGFTAMSSESTPDQVVTLLNDLYSCFDDVINSYDVYKVETIGDAYMVVSGAPIRNGDNHAGEIASMSLSLLDIVNHFRIRHRPTEMLKLRIGIHSAYAVAGVVGARMPRYCLFGEHIQKASRMEQTGEALKIHCSYQCKVILDRIGGYDIVERGNVEVEADQEETTYWVVKENLDYRERRIEAESMKYPNLKRRR